MVITIKIISIRLKIIVVKINHSNNEVETGNLRL